MRIYYNHRVLAQKGGKPELTLEAIARRVTAAYSALHILTGIKVEQPLEDFLNTTDEVGLLTIIEFLHDHIAKPAPS
jgi:hypothetical protein